MNVAFTVMQVYIHMRNHEAHTIHPQPLALSSDKLCTQVTDQVKLTQVLERFLAEYNSSSSRPMGLVFFQDAVDHIASIARLLRQPRGNALLVGVSGSGKQSLTRFAAALGGFTCVQLELKKAYSLTDFREDLKVGTLSLVDLLQSIFASHPSTDVSLSLRAAGWDL